MKNKYEIRGDMVVIFVKSKGAIFEATISKSAFHKTNEFPNSWYAQVHRNVHYVCGVVTVDGKKRHIRLHRWILDVPDNMVVDHIDGNPLNNTYDNIRICTPSENGQNVRSPHHLPRGVKNHRGRYRAVMTLNHERFDLGVYDTVEEADEIVSYFRSKYMPFSTEALNRKTYFREELIDELNTMRQEKKKPSSSLYIGVYKMKDGRWGSQWPLSNHGKPRTTKYIAGFEIEEAAGLAHDIQVFRYYGDDEIHKLNFRDFVLNNMEHIINSDSDVITLADNLIPKLFESIKRNIA